MSKKDNLNENKYFTSKDFDKLVYMQIPRVLLYGEKYKKMSPDAKLLYAICYDLIKLSMENHGQYDIYGKKQCWMDEKGYYILFSINTIQDLLGCGKNKTIKLKKELEKHNLIEQKRLGREMANIIYVLQLDYDEKDVFKTNKTKHDMFKKETEKENPETPGAVVKFKNQTSRSFKIKPLEVSKSNPNKNKHTKNKLNNNNNNKKNENKDVVVDQDKINKIINLARNRNIEIDNKIAILLLNKSKGDELIIKKALGVAENQKKISNLEGFLIKAIEENWEVNSTRIQTGIGFSNNHECKKSHKKIEWDKLYEL